jgi:hypothetical protein
VITYTDGTTQQFTLGFGDWASTTPYPGGQVAATAAYGDTSDSTTSWKATIFYDSVNLEPGKTVDSVSLRGPQNPLIHLFAATIGD